MIYVEWIDWFGSHRMVFDLLSVLLGLTGLASIGLDLSVGCDSVDWRDSISDIGWIDWIGWVDFD